VICLPLLSFTKCIMTVVCILSSLSHYLHHSVAMYYVLHVGALVILLLYSNQIWLQQCSLLMEVREVT